MRIADRDGACRARRRRRGAAPRYRARRLSWLAATLTAALVGSGGGSGALWAAAPTVNEQLMLELVNRFRQNPQAELEILTNISTSSPASWLSPRSDDGDVAEALGYFGVDANTLKTQFASLAAVPPLAWSNGLNESAKTHNLLMITNDDQQHNFPGEPGLIQRMQNGGYVFAGGGTAAENIFAYSESVEYGHAGFVVDWGFGPGGIQSPAGHRNALINANYREIGISVIAESSALTDVGPLVITQHLARANSRGPFVTGVAFNDTLDDDDFYTPGEGLGGIPITVFQANSNTVVASTTTWDSGGYNLLVSAGLYDIVAIDARLGGTVRFDDVTIGTTNVKLDFLPLVVDLIGDANDDGSVGAADYAIWAAQFGQSGQGLSADFDGSGGVGAADYALWAANFGKSNGGSGGGGGGGAATQLSGDPTTSGNPPAVAVPEPAGWIMALAGACGAWLGWRRRGGRFLPTSRQSR